MSDNSTITISLSRPASDSPSVSPLGPSDALALEQCLKSDRWIRRIDLIKALAGEAYGIPYEVPESTDCGVRNVAVCVYLYDPDTNYNIGITHGSLGERVDVPLEVSEVINFKLETTARAKYPVTGILSYEWLGSVYDVNGSPVAGPSPTFSGNEVTIPERIYGSLKIVYAAMRHHYSVQVEAREEAEFSKYSSVVWANWNGGAKLLELEFPGCDDAEDSESGTEVYLNVTYPDDDEIRGPEETGHHEEILIDYCTQERLGE